MVFDVYKRPFDSQYPVACMDESPKQRIAETRNTIPASPGQPAGMIMNIGVAACAIFSRLFYEPMTGKRMV